MNEIPVRIMRDGNPVTLNIEDLTSQEIGEFFKDRSSEELIRWIRGLCTLIRERK